MQPWTNNLATNNYVMYQLFQTGDSALRSNPTQPNTCLVEASSSSYPSVILGLGTVSSNCRVTHFGSQNDVSTIAWTDPTWTSYSSVSPNNADVGLNMIQRFPRLGPGASVTFSWMYGYTQADMTTALNAISSVIIQQPVDTVSGSSATFSAMVTGTVSIVYFYVTFNKTTYSLVGTSTTPSPSVSSGGGLYSIPFNSLAFPSQDGYVVSGHGAYPSLAAFALSSDIFPVIRSSVSLQQFPA